MSKKIQKRKQEARHRAWIYTRYLFPILAVLLMLVALAIPCLRYVTADTGTNDTISTAELLQNSWDQVRVYLFGTAASDQLPENVAFCETVLVILAVSVLLFLVGVVATVWTAIAAFRYWYHPADHSTARILFLTLLPNRTTVCLLGTLTIPLLAFPRILVWVYKSVLKYTVLLKVSFIEPIWIGLALVLAVIVLSIVTAPMERAMDMDPFRKRLIPKEEDEPTEEDEKNDESEIYQRSKEEQMEQIRRLLSKNDEET